MDRTLVDISRNTMENPVTVSGTVAIGVMHSEGDFTFGRDYYFDPDFRWQQDLEIAKWCEETFAPYPIYNAEAHLIQLEHLPVPFRHIGALQPNLIIGAGVGAEFRFYGTQDPDITQYPLQHIETKDEIMGLYKIPWEETEPILTFLKQIDEGRARLSDSGVDIFPPFFWDRSGRATIHGPLTTAHKLMGENFFMKLLDDPETAIAFVDWIADVYIQLITLFAERADHPITGIHIGECSGCLFSPDQWAAALPAMNKLVDACGGCRIHSCGTSDHLVERMAEVHNISNFNIGTNTSVKRSRELVGHAMQLDVIPDPEMLCFGTPDQIRNWVHLTLDENEDGPMEIQFHMDAAVPLKNVQTIFDSCRNRGVSVPYESLVTRRQNHPAC